MTIGSLMESYIMLEGHRRNFKMSSPGHTVNFSE